MTAGSPHPHGAAMQVTTPSEVTSQKPPAGRVLVLPEVLQLLQVSTPEIEQQRQVAEQRARLTRQDENYEEALSQAYQSPRISDIMIQAERRMLPGSQAARQAQFEQVSARKVQQRGDFRTALNDASSAKAAPRNGTGDTSQTQSAATNPKPTESIAGRAPSATDAKQPQATSPPESQSAAPRANATPPAAQAARAATLTIAPSAMVNAAAARSASVAQAAASAAKGASVSAARSTAASATIANSNAASARGAPVAATAGPQRATSTAAAKTTSAQPNPPSEESGKNDANTARILRLMQIQLGRGRATATLRLDPPDLGKIKLQMDLRDTQLGVRMVTETEAARRLLSEQMDTLRRGLEAAGIQLERVELRVAESNATHVRSDVSQDADVPDGREQGAAGQEAPSDGHGRSSGRESAFVESPEAASGEVTELEPAAESLVNVYA